MMHLTCTNMPVEKLDEALQQVMQSGIKNILALRGDPPKGEETFTAVEGGFSCALDLVKYIRKQYGNYFGICVSGYPEAHPDVISDDPEEMERNYWSDIFYLKKKVSEPGCAACPQLRCGRSATVLGQRAWIPLDGLGDDCHRCLHERASAMQTEWQSYCGVLLLVLQAASVPPQPVLHRWLSVHVRGVTPMPVCSQVDAGADMVITQLFYNCDRYIKYVKDCKAVGITCPILPGVMPIMTYGGFKRMTGFCKTQVLVAAQTHSDDGLHKQRHYNDGLHKHMGVIACRSGLPCCVLRAAADCVHRTASYECMYEC